LEADVRRFEYNDAFATTIWIIVVALICMVMLPLLGCSSPTQVEEECVYRADLEAWVGPGCDNEEKGD
jgi:hypothetical protein